MSEVEGRRAVACARAVAGELSVAEAAELMDVSYRQAKRLLSRYRLSGQHGLVHGNVGRTSNRSLPLQEVREKSLVLVREELSGFGPTLAAEHLESEYGLRVGAETLRLWMLGAGLWSRVRKRKPHRQRRERMGHFGELVQVDGSFHHWLGADLPVACLITFIDDATGVVLARFAPRESTWAVTEVLEMWLKRYGVPKAIYADCGSVFQHHRHTHRKGAAEPDATQFGRMLRELGVRLIAARSPQAKGRVERSHGTHQDRLVKKLARAGIKDYESANRFLERYLEDHNARFAVAPREEADFHVELASATELNRVLSLKYSRLVSRDLVISYRTRSLQLLRESRVSPGRRVTVTEARNGTVRLFLSGIELKYEELAAHKANSFRPRPSLDHPWRHPGYRAWAKKNRPNLFTNAASEGAPHTQAAAES